MARHKEEEKIPFTFVDLFAGIGGFHQAMRYLNGTCVMASEIDPDCQATYRANFPKTPILGDIASINPKGLKPYDVLCAGFPCQPFSKAGSRLGFQDPTKGGMFFHVLSFIRSNPDLKFFILENVRNLADDRDNWGIVVSKLKEAGFLITEDPLILSPHEFGIPQVRERVYILGIRMDIADPIKLPAGHIRIEDLHLDKYYKECRPDAALSLLEPSEEVPDGYLVPDEIVDVLDAWEEFRLGTHLKKIGAPVWICAFGLGIDGDDNYKLFVGYNCMPAWKQRFYDKNRKLYKDNREFIDGWVDRHGMLDRRKTHQKFEWNLGNEDVCMKDTIIQIRQSGIRCKRTNYYPALVAMVNTPIIWDRGKGAYRYITPREAANMQSFHGRYRLVGDDNTIYTQLGNSVNVRLLKILGEKLFKLEAASNGREQRNDKHKADDGGVQDIREVQLYSEHRIRRIHRQFYPELLRPSLGA
jgi:DNA (cytosine-5)-methyltransferase 1